LWILKAIHAVIPSWGVSILMLALLVRVLIYPLARKMMADQQKFANVQLLIGPEIKKIKKKYRGEEQSEKILGLYKKHGVSPFTGMKPLVIVVIQLPVFIALFHALGQAAELQDASFLWINTLGLPDQLFSFGQDLPLLGAYFNLLPFLMAFSTLLTIALSPMPGQNNIFLAIMAVVFFYDSK
jgi:YidC/Oxa1 family membrane protein insertase